MFDPKQPLWLPVGSIRAIIALIVVVPLTVLALTSGVKLTSEQYVTIATLVLGFYFIGKAGNTAGR